MARILIVEDDDDFREGLVETITDINHTAFEADSCFSGLNALQQHNPDIVILDHRLGDGDSLEFLSRMNKWIYPIPPVIILTAFATAADTVEAIKLGAFDHLLKPLSRNDLVSTIERALLSGRHEENISPPSTILESNSVIGNSPIMRKVLKLIGLAAVSNVTVLFLGETGSGKEVLARLLHQSKHQTNAPFVAVNCAAIPADLLESELFGHVKGAFTGAISNRIGRFSQAQGGTLFLDEIGDMPLAMQAKLLRVIESKHFSPVGSAQENIADVRLIAATHHDLIKQVSLDHFREDLFHRLNVFPIQVPALRDRPEDIPALAHHFLNHFSKSTKKLSTDALNLLLKHSWTGNVRELRNVIEHACVIVRGTTIEENDIRIQLQPPTQNEITTAEILHLPLAEAVSTLERILIQRALHASQNNRTEAARRLGIHRQLLYTKLKEYGID